MGVSYAAPAYYADRLCERGRCYLRELFSPPHSAREQLDEMRRKEEKRLILFQPKQAGKETEKNSREEKDKERQAEKEKKEKVENVLKKTVYDRALQRWNADEDENHRGEHTASLLKTMYWM
jgi:eukaryotic translation initiation factor 2C